MVSYNRHINNVYMLSYRMEEPRRAKKRYGRYTRGLRNTKRLDYETNR